MVIDVVVAVVVVVIVVEVDVVTVINIVDVVVALVVVIVIFAVAAIIFMRLSLLLSLSFGVLVMMSQSSILLMLMPAFLRSCLCCRSLFVVVADADQHVFEVVDKQGLTGTSRMNEKSVFGCRVATRVNFRLTMMNLPA